MDEVFWKLQSAFWWGFKEIATDEDIKKAKMIARLLLIVQDIS